MKIIKNLQLRRILCRIKRAKKLYLNEVYCCMCPCMMEAFAISFDKIKEVVPEFNTTFLGVSPVEKMGLWWPPSDKQSRIRAFNLLIGYYENKIKTFNF